MKSRNWLAVLGLAAAMVLVAGGCGVPRGIGAAVNRHNLGCLNIGMDKEAALKVMGKAYSAKGDTVNAQAIEYLFYTTKMDSALDYTTSCRELTVLKFVNGKLEYWKPADEAQQCP